MHFFPDFFRFSPAGPVPLLPRLYGGAVGDGGLSGAVSLLLRRAVGGQGQVLRGAATPAVLLVVVAVAAAPGHGFLVVRVQHQQP